MKTRKILDLTDDISMELKGEVLEISLGKKKLELSKMEVMELHTWLGKEVLGMQYPGLIDGPTPQELIIPKNVLSGPINPAGEKQAVTTTGDLESRRAISTSAPKTYPQVQLSRQDDMKVHNLSGELHKAKDAFSKDNINKGE